jgi:2-haloacid dehalogenase
MSLVLFDLNGTLLDPGKQLPVLQRAVQLAMAHTLAGDFRPFGELLQAAGGEVPDEMPAYDDAAPALGRLDEAGHRLAVLTNSERATAEQQLARAGIDTAFERVIGTDEIGAYKPERGVYLRALELLGADGAEAWLVAAHDWDLVGAHNAGLRTAFVDRGLPAPSTITPDRSLTTLTELTL